MSSSRSWIVGNDIRSALRRPELRRGWLAESALVALLMAGWAIARGASAPELDDAGLFIGMAVSVVAHAGAVAAAWRAGPPDEQGARVVRSGLHLYAGAALALAQLLVLIPLFLLNDLAFILLGSVVGCFVGGLALGTVALLVGLSMVVWHRLGPGAGVLARASMGLVLASAVVAGTRLALGSDVPGPGARPALSTVVLTLLGLEGETTSSAWLWSARAAALSCAVWMVVLTRALRRRRIRRSD